MLKPLVYDSSSAIERAYRLAVRRYAEYGVDVDAALERLSAVSISLHCWQGDDVAGFEQNGAELGGGLAVTGHYCGKARTPDELRADLDVAYSMIPGHHRLNLHASYADATGGRPVDRDELAPEHFRGWLDWAKESERGLDFNPTYFAHPKAADGFTLTHPDRRIRDFWVNHGVACRRIGAAFGEELGTACVTNLWIPDGMKDLPADRRGPRERLIEALDAILAEPMDRRVLVDSVECKLYGIGSESYVVGSHEFYLGYAITRELVLCLDSGHFHPTESVADKLSAVFPWVGGVMLHISRGVRWDSDHVPILSDELLAIAHELVRGDYLGRTYLGLDFFDASINRVAAWVIGARSLLKAMLVALLEPVEALRRHEEAGDFTGRLALMEEAKSLPFGAVWEYHCLMNETPTGLAWLDDLRQYERNVLMNRG